MIILAIETSCDDTCCAVVKVKAQNTKRKTTTQNSKLENIKFEIFSNIVSSQVSLHSKYGGVYPSLAKREHEKNLPKVVKKAINQAKNPKVDLIAVTVGPGLDPCLWTGINFAADLTKKRKLALVLVNHIEAHILASLLAQTISNFQFSISNFQKGLPAVALVVSGGHTQLILVKRVGQYQILGETRDDAAGECFDKTARILGLGYPGGPAIAQQAAQLPKKQLLMINDKLSINLPRPMIYSKDYDFSFSGLKTAVLYHFKSQSKKTQKSAEYIQAMSAEIQQAVIDALIKKTIKAVKDYRVKTIILAGGVAANNELRMQLNHKLKTVNYKLNFWVPAKIFCTDNAVMVATAAYFNRSKVHTKDLDKISSQPNLRV